MNEQYCKFIFLSDEAKEKLFKASDSELDFVSILLADRIRNIEVELERHYRENEQKNL